MRGLRVLSAVVKPLLSPLAARSGQVVCGTYRSITTGKDQVMLGNVGGTMRRHEEPEYDFNIFFGKWVQELHMLTTPEGEVKGPIIPTDYHSLVNKPKIKYAMHGPVWHIHTGFKHKGYNVYYKFIIGKPFLIQYPDNGLFRVLVFYDDNYMKWAFQPHYFGDQTVPAMKKAIHHITEVREDKLIWKTEYPDMSFTTKTYFRE